MFAVDEGEDTAAGTCDIVLFAKTGKSERSRPLFMAATDDIVSVFPDRPKKYVCKRNLSICSGYSSNYHIIPYHKSCCNLRWVKRGLGRTVENYQFCS